MSQKTALGDLGLCSSPQGLRSALLLPCDAKTHRLRGEGRGVVFFRNTSQSRFLSSIYRPEAANKRICFFVVFCQPKEEERRDGAYFDLRLLLSQERSVKKRKKAPPNCSNLLTKAKRYGIIQKLKNVDEELRKRKPYREHAFGGSVQSVLFCDIPSELTPQRREPSRRVRMAALKHRSFSAPGGASEKKGMHACA